VFTRKDVAAQLSEAARLIEVLGEDPFRARSFQNAARAFEAFEGDVGRLYREGRLGDVRGVGASIRAELMAMFEQGVLPSLAELRLRVPDEVREMFAVSGLGAKKIGGLWRSGIVGVDGLIEAAESGRLASLPGFGAKSAGNLLSGARFVAESRSRMRLDEADRISEAVVAAIQGELPGARAEAAGEYRRGLETVAGLEFVVSGPTRSELEALAVRLFDSPSEEPLNGLLMGRRLRLTHAPAEEFGALLALRTGNEEFVTALRARARECGIDLPDEGGRGGPDTRSESALFARLGTPYIPPELRESAAFRPVEDLVELRHLRGLVHNHSTWSDGTLSMREMSTEARRLGFAYLAMADHSRNSAVANGLGPERVLAQAEEVRAIREELEGGGFELLHGMEVDILSDGTLDLPDELLARLDYTVASVHQNFGLPLIVQTDRIVRAVHSPHVDILGHATGRLLLRRPGYEVDLEAVIEACAQSGTVIEINANPRRLDLDWRWVIRARDAGCLFTINPDAHSATGFDDLRYGVTMARKAGLTVSQVVNTAGTGREFLARLETR
jgi:DNA polymerase (family 10)